MKGAMEHQLDSEQPGPIVRPGREGEAPECVPAIRRAEAHGVR
jgi:hypothetical protein